MLCYSTGLFRICIFCRAFWMPSCDVYTRRSHNNNASTITLCLRIRGLAITQVNHYYCVSLLSNYFMYLTVDQKCLYRVLCKSVCNNIKLKCLNNQVISMRQIVILIFYVRLIMRIPLYYISNLMFECCNRCNRKITLYFTHDTLKYDIAVVLACPVSLRMVQRCEDAMNIVSQCFQTNASAKCQT